MCKTLRGLFGSMEHEEDEPDFVWCCIGGMGVGGLVIGREMRGEAGGVVEE